MLKDLRFALRMLQKNPAFVAVAIFSLAIGIGANSAVYSFADTMILRPLPILKPSQVVTVNAPATGMFGASSSISYPDYVDLRDRNRSFDGLIASTYSSFGFAPASGVQPRMKFGMFVSGNFFQVLGIEPALGRAFRPDEDRVTGTDAVAILSHDLWVDDFGANPAVVGQKLQLNGTEFTIVGVAPESFTGLGQLKPALFVPIHVSPRLGHVDNLVKREARWLDVKGRLKPGVKVAQAQADVSSIVTALRSLYPKLDENLQLKVETELELRAERSPPDTTLTVMLGVLALCVLLVACANVAGLLLSRSTVRAREIAVRLAMGASRFSLVRQLLVENLVLAVGGGAAGLLVATGAVKFFNTLPLPTDIPLDLNFRLDDRALLFTLSVAVGSTFLFGLAPALQGTRLDLIRALKERDGTASKNNRLWGRNLIVAGQVALSLVLLIVSGVLLDGFRAQLGQGPGFRTKSLQLMSFDPNLVHYTDAQRETFYRQLLDQTRQAPGVRSAALTSGIPLSMGGFSSMGVIPEGRELKRGEQAIDTFDGVVSPGFFETMSIPLVRGRGFRETDKANTPLVAIVNEEFARHHWPNQDAMGKRLRLKDQSGKLVQVVGIARVSKYLWISEAPTGFVYLPYSQNGQATMTLVAESKDSNAAALVPILRRVSQTLDRNMPVFDVRTMQSLYESRAVATPNLITRTVAAMGLMGLSLSIIGLYGVVSYSVSKRSREFGIRMAVGADRLKVVSMVLKQGLTVGLAGLAVGLVVGVFVVRALASSLLFAFPVGLMPFAVVSLLLLVCVLGSAYVPARRASLVDPMSALREE